MTAGSTSRSKVRAKRGSRSKPSSWFSNFTVLQSVARTVQLGIGRFTRRSVRCVWSATVRSLVGNTDTTLGPGPLEAGGAASAAETAPPSVRAAVVSSTADRRSRRTVISPVSGTGNLTVSDEKHTYLRACTAGPRAPSGRCPYPTRLRSTDAGSRPSRHHSSRPEAPYPHHASSKYRNQGQFRRSGDECEFAGSDATDPRPPRVSWSMRGELTRTRMPQVMTSPSLVHTYTQ